jgi:thiol reductant ABC exporter CydD subunit
MWPTELLRGDRTARRQLLLSIGCGLVASALFALWSILLGQIIAAAFIDGRSLADLRGPSICMILLIAARALLLRMRGSLAQRASTSCRSRLRRRLLGLALRRPSAASRASSAEQTALIGGAVDALDPYLTAFVPARIDAVILPLVIATLITVIDPWSTLVLALAGPLLIALLAVIGRRTRDLAAARFEELFWLGSLYADLLGGLATLKVFGREQDALDTVTETSAQFGRSTMKVLRTAFQTSLVIEWAATASTALVAVEVSFRLVDHHLPFSTALAVLILTPEFFAPLRTLAAEYHAGQTGTAALLAIDAFLGEEPADPPLVEEVPDRVPEMKRSGAPIIEFDTVGFTHLDRDASAIDELSFAIARGETVALDGPSGCGKTTAIMLLMGFERPSSGRILVDGQMIPTTEAGLDRWRSRIAWVPQHPTLFSGSIADNIRLGRRDATSDEVEAAARAACIHTFLATLPGGYDTTVGAGGARLSGGQRQRIALARALLLDAPVMILDEFTAHLDPRTEAEVIASITPLLRDRTVLLITHRPAALALANKTITLRSADAAADPR